MSSTLRSSIYLWIILFSIVSFYHSLIKYLELRANPSFDPSYTDILIIGLILIFVSLSSSFLIFLLMTYLINKSDQTNRNLIEINLITLVFSVITFLVSLEGTASWSEALIYSGSYVVSFFIVVNRYFFKLKRIEEDIQNQRCEANN